MLHISLNLELVYKCIHIRINRQTVQKGNEVTKTYRICVIKYTKQTI